MNQHDVIVIGSGTAGYNVAKICRAAGLDTAVVERTTPGGTCALHGCQPKKFFVVQAELATTASHLVGKGVRRAPELAWSETAAFRREFTEAVPGNTVSFFERIGARLYQGQAEFQGAGQLRVGEHILQAKTVVLATGAEPRTLDIPGAELTINSNEFLALEDLPSSFVFIGGGYISFEFAHIAAAYGSKVTILNHTDRVLQQFDPEMVDKAVAATRDAGIEIHMNQHTVAVEKTADGLRVVCRDGQEYETAAVVVAAGRTANLADLNLASLGLKVDPRGLTVDPQMRVAGTENLYAVGDCARTISLAPVADQEAIVAASVITGENAAMSYDLVPSVCFTSPPLAAVGLTETQAQAQGLEFTVKRGNTTKWPNQRRLGASHGAYKLLIGSDGKLLGAHLLGHEAGETINLFALALRGGLPATVFKEMMWAYPTLASDVKYMV